VPGFLGSEPFGAEMYGLLLLCSMVLLVIAAVALTAMQIARRQKFRARLLDVDLAGLSSRMYGAEAAPAALLDGTGTGQNMSLSAEEGFSVPGAGGSVATTPVADDVDLPRLSSHMYSSEAPAALLDGTGQSMSSLSEEGFGVLGAAGSDDAPHANVTVAGQSRPASPDRITAVQPVPELELAARAE
jgi:hypothetical protein